MLSFAQPWFLLGFIALILPILAHLIQSRHTQIQVFPSVRFIKSSKIPQSNEKRLADFLLLLLRLLILSSITLALAGTHWQTEEDLNQEQETIIIIDNSASMSATNKQQQLHHRLETTLETLEGGLGLIIFGNKIQHTLSPQGSKTDILSILNKLNTRFSQGHPQEAINAALTMFNPGVEKKQLLIISDFQTSNWQNVTAKLNQAGVSLTLKRLSSFNGNTSILHAFVSPLSSESLRVSVKMYNDTNQTQNRTLKLDAGHKSWQQDLSLMPNKYHQAFFKIPRQQYEKAELSFTEEDEYPADDHYFLWLKDPPAIPGAVLSSPFNNNAAKKETYFVRTALQSHSAYDWQRYSLSGAQYFDSSIFDQDLSQSLSQSLWQSTFIFIAGLPGDIAPALLSQLHSYMEQGGIVMATPGYSVAQSLEKLSAAKILNARYINTQRQNMYNSEPFRISHINPRSIIKQLFIDETENDLKLTRIYKYIKLEFAEDVDVLMEVDDGQALLIKKNIGKGQFIYSSLKFDLGWTDLPLGNSFLPLIRELLSANNTSVAWPTLSIGETFNDDLTINSNNSPGFIASEVGLFVHNKNFVSVNVSRQESHSKQLSNTQLIENLSSSKSGSEKFSNGNSGRINLGNINQSTKSFDSNRFDPNSFDKSKQHDILLWPWLILLACLLFMCESIVAGTKTPFATEDM